MSNTMWIVVTVVAVVGAVAMGLWLKSIHRKLTDKVQGYQAPQLRFRYTEADFCAESPKLGPDGRKVLRTFDKMFVLMLIFVGLCMAVVTHNATQYQWLRWVMYGLTAVGCAFGELETLLLLGEKKGAKAASICSLLKWVCFGVWVAGMFIGLFIKSTAL